MERGGAVSYYAADGLGSINTLGDTAGTAQNSYAYDAWGSARSSTELMPQPFRYTARESGDMASQWFYRARFYAPAAGRFLSEDPIRFEAGGINFFVYVDNDPTHFTDPDGHKAACAWEIHSRPTRGIRNMNSTRHKYFFNRATGQSKGLTTGGNVVVSSASPWGSVGKWQTRETHKDPHHKNEGPVSDDQCDCVNDRMKDRSKPPRYCTVPQKQPKPSFPPCHNCQSWVASVLKDCS